MAKALLLTALLTLSIQAQESDKPLPDRWRNLVIDQSTPEEAITRLGKPAEDKARSPRTYPLNKRVRIDHNTKGSRKLVYKNLEGVKEASLYFIDGKLSVIDLRLKEKLPATTFPNLYEIEFWPKVSDMEQALEPGAYERNEGRVYPKNYPVVYYLVANTEKTYVSAMVSNGGFGSLMLGSRRSKMGDDDLGGFPGKVESVQIVTRRFEKALGGDALK